MQIRNDHTMSLATGYCFRSNCDLYSIKNNLKFSTSRIVQKVAGKTLVNQSLQSFSEEKHWQI